MTSFARVHQRFASPAVMADPALFPIPETDCDCFSSISDNECDVAPKASLLSKQRVNFVLKPLNKLGDAIRLEPHGNTTRKHDLRLLAGGGSFEGISFLDGHNNPVVLAKGARVASKSNQFSGRVCPEGLKKLCDTIRRDPSGGTGRQGINLDFQTFTQTLRWVAILICGDGFCLSAIEH